jgi:S-(hydroxymethyl)glutathione dehydrogenase/alcohol dehydrogenase
MAMSTNFKEGDADIFGFAGTGTWAEEVVLPEQGVVVIPKDVPFEIGALIGCGVTTGVGAAINTAHVEVGSSVVVFGCGGVGISAIQGARVAGAAEIVAVDMVKEKLEDAKRFGATHAAHPDDLDAIRQEVTGGEGFDYAFECIGIAPTFRAAWDATRRGGTTVIVGAGRTDSSLEINGFELFFTEKKLLGSYYGSANVKTEFHRLIRLWKAGRIDLESMVTRRITLDDVNDGIKELKAGSVIRQVVTLS